VPESPRTRRGPRLSAEERRESILRAATEVFAESGYQRARTSDIAARVGVTEPVVFQNFGSKSALYAAVFDRMARALSESMRRAASDETPVSGLLARFLSHDHIDEFHAPGAAGFLFADAMTAVGEPAVEEAARAGIRTFAEALADVLRKGQSDGDVRADLDPEAMAWWLLSHMASHRFRTSVLPARGGLADKLDEVVLHTLTG
jgi:AcrR family transcriptional regulator